MGFIGSLIIFALQIYLLVIIVQVALSWLVAFDIVNSENDAARNLNNLTKKLTDYKPFIACKTDGGIMLVFSHRSFVLTGQSYFIIPWRRYHLRDYDTFPVGSQGISKALSSHKRNITECNIV